MRLALSAPSRKTTTRCRLLPFGADVHQDDGDRPRRPVLAVPSGDLAAHLLRRQMDEPRGKLGDERLDATGIADVVGVGRLAGRGWEGGRRRREDPVHGGLCSGVEILDHPSEPATSIVPRGMDVPPKRARGAAVPRRLLRLRAPGERFAQFKGIGWRWRTRPWLSGPRAPGANASVKVGVSSRATIADRDELLAHSSDGSYSMDETSPDASTARRSLIEFR